MGNLARNIIRASFSQEIPPWCDPFAYRRFRLCIIRNLAFQVYRIDDRSGPGMSHISEETKVVYQSKDGKQEKVFDALKIGKADISHKSLRDGDRL